MPSVPYVQLVLRRLRVAAEFTRCSTSTASRRVSRLPSMPPHLVNTGSMVLDVAKENPGYMGNLEFDLKTSRILELGGNIQHS